MSEGKEESETGKQADLEKLAVLENLAVHLDQVQGKYLKRLIDGLSDSDVGERRAYARIIADTVVPALVDDTNPETKARSLKTLNVLIAELRPPRNEGERWDLNNAAFFTVMRHLSSMTKRNA